MKTEWRLLMTTKTVSIRMDENLYRELTEFSDRVYIPVSALISSFAAATVREQRLPFEIAVDRFYEPANQAYLAAGIDELEAGGGTKHELIDA
jgi:DNA-damage-inducible protein J